MDLMTKIQQEKLLKSQQDKEKIEEKETIKVVDSITDELVISLMEFEYDVPTILEDLDVIMFINKRGNLVI